MAYVWFDPFWTPAKKHTFTDVYFQQAFVADSFKRPSFWAHVNQKGSKLIILISFGLYRLHYED